MKNNSTQSDFNDLQSNVALHKLVNQLLSDLLPAAVRRKSLILNNIDKDFRIKIDEDMLALILWNMINGAITSTQDECIHIDASLNGDCTTIEVKDNGSYFYSRVSDRLKFVQPVVEKLGGCISINSNTSNGTIIVFTIANVRNAA